MQRAADSARTISGLGEPPRALSQLGLVRRIVEESDLQALEEFHMRQSVFAQTERSWIRLSEYLSLLREQALQHAGAASHPTDEEIDRAYDLTTDKFLNFPGRGASGRQAGRSAGPDCRRYFRAYLQYVENELQSNAGRSPLQKEMLAAGALQRFIWRHFNLSLLEAKRRTNPFVSRYFWKVNGARICLSLPRHMTGAEKRRWLETHVAEPDPQRLGERQRIQRIIDRRLEMGSFFSLNEPGGLAALCAKCARDRPVLFADGPSLSKLDQVVAREKAENLRRQRPAIRALGPERLEAMILRIFDELMHDRFRDGRIAREFGLSKASFSRFAGSRWDRKLETVVPDLWANTAQVLSSFAPFVEAAQETGIWESIRVITKRQERQ